jgi:hypothetical protein
MMDEKCSVFDELIKFADFYRPIHGWLSIIFCVFGIPTNLFNILVLTRQNMIKSPTNTILTGIAFSDLIIMISYSIFSLYFYIIHIDNFHDPFANYNTFFWTHFSLFHVFLSVTTHSISIWFTVYLAFFRYFFIKTYNLSAKKEKSNLYSIFYSFYLLMINNYNHFNLKV